MYNDGVMLKKFSPLILLLILALLAGCQPGDVSSSLPEKPASQPASLPPAAAILPGADLRFEHLSIEEGLSQSVVNAIVQDRTGFLWFGTQDGLNRYDGYTFTIFKSDPADPQALADDWITALQADEDGSLWIGTNQGGLHRFDATTGKIIRFSDDPALRIFSNANIHTLFIDSQNTLWVGANDGLNRFHLDTRALESFTHDDENSATITNGAVTAIFQDSRDRLWVGTEHGLNRYLPEDNTFQQIVGDQEGSVSIRESTISAIAEDETGLLWLASNQGLIWFDPETELYSSYVHDAQVSSSLSHNYIHDLRIDRNGLLWIGTELGLDRYDPTTDTFIHYRYNPLVESGLSTDVIYSIYEDREGLLWFGSWGGGVNKYNPHQNQFALYRHNPNNPDSINGSVFPIFPEADGLVWVGVMSIGLDKFDSTTGSLTHFNYDAARQDGLASPIILNILRDSQGVLWLATANGLDQYDEANNRFIHHKLEDGSSNVFTAIYEDPSGSFWVGSMGGLNLFDRSTGQFVPIGKVEDQDPAPPIAINNIFAGRNGDLWLTTSGMGVYRYHPGQQNFERFIRDSQQSNTLASDIVLWAYEDELNNLWLATTAGLNKLNLVTREYSLYTEQQGLPNSFIYCIIPDQSGDFWLPTNFGLSRFNPQADTFQNFSVEDGLQSNEFNSNACARAADGSIYVGGISGMNRFFPEKVVPNQYLPPIAITRLTSGGNALRKELAAESVYEFSLKWPNNSFEFEFAALSFSQPEKTTYAYRLDNFDSDWNELRSQRVGRYTNLPGGRYTLRLRSTTPSGLTHEEPQTIQVTVIPPFWQTAWFLGLGGLLLGGLVYGAYRLRVRSIVNQKQELERQVNERTYEIEQLFEQTKELAIIEERNRLARELHDSAKQKAFAALAQLGTAKGLIQRNLPAAAQHMSEAENLVHDVIQELTFLIQEMYPLALQEKGLVTTLREYIFEWENRTDIQTDLHAENEQHLPLNVEQALYRITQESLANVARHSRASHVTLNLVYDAENVTLTILDDGIGFDMAQKPKGIGLRSIRERAESIGGEINISSLSGNGTRIEVRIPIQYSAGG